jgi:hypothetical protein
MSRHRWTLLIGAVLNILMLYPLLAFLWSGWQQRSREILGSLNATAKKQYLSIFQKATRRTRF